MTWIDEELLRPVRLGMLIAARYLQNRTVVVDDANGSEEGLFIPRSHVRPRLHKVPNYGQLNKINIKFY